MDLYLLTISPMMTSTGICANTATMGVCANIRLYVLCTMTSKPPNPRLKIYLIHIHCDIWPHGGQKIWFQPAVLLPFRAFWVVNQQKLILLAVNLQGSYLYLYRTELQKLHEVWKDFFKSVNLGPTGTKSLNSFRSYSWTNANMKFGLI